MANARADGQGEVDIYTMPAVFMLKAKIPEELVDGLNDYLDEYLEDEERESLANTLVGTNPSGRTAKHSSDLTMSVFSPM